MATYSGVLNKIKDKNCHLDDKLKLVQFAWCSSLVLIPNKHSVLIDTVTGLLVNKKKYQLNEEEVVAVWKCLHSALRSWSRFSDNSESLVVKPSLGQVIVDALHRCAQDVQQTPLKMYALGCCKIVITSAHLAHIITSKYESLTSIIASLCHICLDSVEDEVSATCGSILSCTIPAFSAAQSDHHSQKQVLQTMIDRLLLPLMVFYDSPFVRSAESHLRESVVKCLLDAIFHSSHREMYRRYLNKGGDKSSEGCRPLEKLFETLRVLLTVKLPDGFSRFSFSPKDVVYTFLPRFLEAFLKLYDKSLCHKMNQRLFSLIGWDDDSTAISLDNSSVMDLASCFLGQVKDSDVYNVARDNEAGQIQFKFYRRLVEKIIDTDITDAWYNTLMTLLQMNHGILEPKMTQILIKGWLEAQESRNLSTFLCELFDTYSKLRQMTKLIGFVLTAVGEVHETLDHVSFPKQFTDKFCQIVSSLPQTTSVDIWNQLVQEMGEKYVSPLEESSKDKTLISKLSFVSSLLAVYMSGLKVVDYSVTDVTSRKVQDLMMQMELRLLQPMVEICLHNGHLLASTLYLIYTWGELKLLLALYDKRYRATTNFDTATVSHHTDMTLVHPYLTSDKLERAVNTVKNRSRMTVQYLCDLLRIQKLKAVLMFSQDDLETIKVKLFSCLSNIVSLPDEVTEDDCSACWDGQVVSIKRENSLVSRWHTVVGHVPTFSSILSVDHWNSVADFVIATFDPSEKTSAGFCPASLTSELLASVTMETRPLISSLISTVLKKFNPTDVAVSPKKKRKRSAKINHVSEGLQVLADLTDSDLREVERFAEVVSLVSQVISDEHDGESLSFDQRQINLIQMFEYLPLESLSSHERTRCFCGLLLLAATCSSHRDRLLRLLTILLDSLTPTTLFQTLPPSEFLSWLVILYERHEDFDVGILNTLQDKSCRAIIYDFQVVVTMESFITKLCDDLEASSDQLRNKKIHEGSNLDRARFSLTSCLLNHLTAQLQKPFLPSAIRSCCRRLFMSLSQVIMKIVSTMRMAQSKKRVISPSTHLVSCFLSVLRQSCSDCARNTPDKSSDIAVEKDFKFLRIENDQWKLSEELVSEVGFVLERVEETFDANFDEDDGKVSLQFIRTVCENRAHLSILTTEKLHHLSELLTKCLQNLYEREVEFDSSKYGTTKELATRGNVAVEEREFKSSNQKNENIRSLLAETLSAVVSSDRDLFKETLTDLVNSTALTFLEAGEYRRKAAIHLWEKLLALCVKEEQSVEITTAAQHVMMNYQSCLEYLHGLPPEGAILQALTILRSQRNMLSYGFKLLPRQTSVLCLHGCRVVPLDVSSFQLYVPACTAVQEVLSALLIHHPNAVLSVIPSYMACVRHLLVSVIQHGCQDKLLSEREHIEPMVQCAGQVTRLVSLLEPYKLEFSKAVVYVLADYACEVQKVTLLLAVKKALVPGIYILLDLADRYQITQLLALLPHGTKEVFKILYSDYTKYHKYSGKV